MDSRRRKAVTQALGTELFLASMYVAAAKWAGEMSSFFHRKGEVWANLATIHATTASKIIDELPDEEPLQH